MPPLSRLVLPVLTLSLLPAYFLSAAAGFLASAVFFPPVALLSLLRRATTLAKDSLLPRVRARLVACADAMEPHVPPARRRTRTRSYAVLAAADADTDLAAPLPDFPSVRRRRSSGALKTWEDIVSQFKASPVGDDEPPSARPARPPTPGRGQPAQAGRRSPKANANPSAVPLAGFANVRRSRAGSGGALAALTAVDETPRGKAGRAPPPAATPPMREETDDDEEEEEEEEEEEDGALVFMASSPQRKGGGAAGQEAADRPGGDRTKRRTGSSNGRPAAPKR
ncbi:hypothetical protein DFJ74DRAFT_705520 [Hyaloraphidium curvatum]|nr:hypothetical protein DFJ74DRAFT_705520 [Hyaloraphidium curvatum]